MKKVFTILFCLMLGFSAIAQQKIQLRSADRAECTKSDMTSLKASFSFSTIEAEDVTTKGGEFSWLSMPNTVIGGNEGDPQIPVVNQLIAVPVGAEPTITVTSYSTKEYNLTEMGIKTLMPRQLPLRKNQKPEDVPFIMNQEAYQTRGLSTEPKAVVEVAGTMRGVRLGKITIEPVSYDPVNNTLRVFNNIEVEVSFNGANAKATEDLLIDTYSPYFDIVYKQLFNGRAILDAYSEHPDLYTTPVKMLVVTTQEYQNSTAFQNWLTWKKQKGINVDIYTVTTSTASSTIRTNIQSRYNANHPTFLVIVGDETVVKPYTTSWDCDSSSGLCVNDMEYASVDNDVYHDMFMSRMAVSSTTELGNLVNKILTYEKYTMSDPSYLSNVLLIAGNDSGSWDDNVGRPTIRYALNNYYNTAHGFSNVYSYITSTYTGCYNNLSTGVGFANYTAHGSISSLSDPSFTVSNVSSLTNNDKYFWLVANCCLSANWGNSSTSPCLGEALIRAANKGAFGYIGSIPETLWYEDYYFGVGAFSYVAQTVQTTSSTTTGMYDALFDETAFNTLNSVPYIGNVAVTYAHAANYTSSVDDEYYWRAYQCLGDGSVMPYNVAPAANTVSHANQIVAGVSSFRVYADSRSYVSITVNNEIIGVAAVPANATYVDVPFTTTPQAGQTAMIVVTRNQRQPYINSNVPVIGSGEQYTITANVNNTAWGYVEGAGTYYENTQCTLTAAANHGYAFERWNDNNTENPRTITVTGNATYTAYFRELEEHPVTYNPTQSHGTISVYPENAYAGDEVTLTAHPDAGYMLDHWTVTTVGKVEIPVVDNKFIMPDSEVNITATFKSEPVELTLYNSTNTSRGIPMYAYYFDECTKAQHVIPASELSDMLGGTITKIKYYYTTDSSSNTPLSSATQSKVSVDVYIKEVASTSISSLTDFSSEVPVFSGYFTFETDGSVEITLDDSYSYQGGNLMIGIENPTAGGSGNYHNVYFYGEAGTSGASTYAYSSSSNVSYNSDYTTAFLPKTTFTYEAATNFCAKPANLHVVGEIGPRSVTMGWDAATGDVFQYAMVQGHGINLETVTYAGTTPTGEMTWNNLTPDSDYTVVIRRKCDEESYSQPVSMEFHTAVSCPAPTLALVENSETTRGATVSWTDFSDSYTLQYVNPATATITGYVNETVTVLSEGFEDGDIPEGWTIEGDGTWAVGTGNAGSLSSANTGDYNAQAEHINRGNMTYLITPAMDLSNATSATISLWYSNEIWPSDVDGFGVYYRVNGGSWNELFYTDESHATWTEIDKLALTGLAANYQIGFLYEDNFGYGVTVDDIEIVAEMSEPQYVWNEIENATSPYTFDNLEPGTTYRVRVIGDCGSSGNSQPSNIVGFTTLETCPTPQNLEVTTDGATATATWTGTEGTCNISINGTVTNNVTSPYTFDVNLSSNYAVMVQSNCPGDETSDWSDTFSFTTPPCVGGHVIEYTLNDSYGDGWNGNAIIISDACDVVETLTIADGSSNSGALTLCGDYYQITWQIGNYASETSFSLIVDDTPIYTNQSGSGLADGQVLLTLGTVDMLAKPTDLAAGTPDKREVELSWTENGTATVWEICVNGIENNPVVANSNPFTLDGLTPDTDYAVKVRAVDGADESCWSDEIIFHTAVACVRPENLTEADITYTTVDLSWDGTNDSYVAQYGTWTQVGTDHITTSTLTPYTFDLSGFSGTGTVAIRHYNVTDMFRMNVDDIVVRNASNEIVYSQDFESGDIPSNISNIDLDGDGNDWDITSSNINGYYGVTSASWYNQVALTPDNWLVISDIPLGGSITFYAIGQDPSVPSENFGVFAIADNQFTEAYSGTETSCKITGLTEGTAYVWRVKGLCGAESSVWVSSMFKTKDDLLVFATDGAWDETGNWTDADGNSVAALPTVSNKVRIDANATIASGVVATAKSAVINGGSIIIEDGGQLKQGTTVKVTMHKEITGYGAGHEESADGYYFISTPHSCSYFEENNTFPYVLNVTDGNYDLYAFDPTASQEWINFKAESSHSAFTTGSNTGLFNMKGYLYANEEDKDLTYVGTVSSSLNNTLTENFVYNASSTDRMNGFKLVGNPFTCNGYLSFTPEGGTTPSHIDFYVLNDEGNGYTLGTTSVALAPCQGALFYADASGVINYSSEDPSDKASRSVINIDLTHDGKVTDMARVRFGEGMRLAKKTFRDDSSIIYIPQDDNDYAVVYSNADGEMPVNFKATTTGSYTIGFNLEGIHFDYLHLIDKVTGDDIDLLRTPKYSFIGSPRDDEERFTLVFRTYPSNDIFAYQSGSDIIVVGDGELQVYDLTGRFVMSCRVNGTERISAASLSNAVYIFRMIGNEIKTQKIIVK